VEKDYFSGLESNTCQTIEDSLSNRSRRSEQPHIHRKNFTLFSGNPQRISNGKNIREQPKKPPF